MISSWQRHQFARCADADLDRAPVDFSDEKFVLMQVVSQYSGQNEQRGRRRGSRDGEPQQSFQHFLFFYFGRYFPIHILSFVRGVTAIGMPGMLCFVSQFVVFCAGVRKRT